MDLWLAFNRKTDSEKAW